MGRRVLRAEGLEGHGILDPLYTTVDGDAPQSLKCINAQTHRRATGVEHGYPSQHTNPIMAVPSQSLECFVDNQSRGKTDIALTSLASHLPPMSPNHGLSKSYYPQPLPEQLRFPACEPGQLAECRSPGFTGYVRKTVCSPENLVAPAASCTPTSR